MKLKVKILLITKNSSLRNEIRSQSLCRSYAVRSLLQVIQGIMRGGGVKKRGPTHVSQNLKSKNNASRWIKIRVRVHVSRLFSKIHSSILSSLFIAYSKLPSANFPNRVLFQSGILSRPRFSDSAFKPVYSMLLHLRTSSDFACHLMLKQTNFQYLLCSICQSFTCERGDSILHAKLKY